MSNKKVRTELLQIMLDATKRISIGITSYVHVYSNALVNLISMDHYLIQVIYTYLQKLGELERTLPTDNTQQPINDLGDKYNEAIHILHDKEVGDKIVNHHEKKITKNFIKNNYSVTFPEKETFDNNYRKELVEKMILANENITSDSDTTFLAHEYASLFKQIGNPKELNNAELIRVYEDEEERLVRFREDWGYSVLDDHSQSEIKRRELIINNQEILLNDLEAGYEEAIEYFAGKKQRVLQSNPKEN